MEAKKSALRAKQLLLGDLGIYMSRAAVQVVGLSYDMLNHAVYCELQLLKHSQIDSADELAQDYEILPRVNLESSSVVTFDVWPKRLADLLRELLEIEGVGQR
jgi:hypothetical protein